MIDVNQLRKGTTYTEDGELYKVISYSHHKPGRGAATIRVTIRNLRTGSTVEKTYEQSQMNKHIFGDDLLYLKEGMAIKLASYNGEIIDYELPTTLEMEVVESELAVAGDTANNPTKKVTLETGLVVTVPMFVKEGDVIRVKTEDGSYVTRV